MTNSTDLHTVYTLGYRAPGAMDKLDELIVARGMKLLDIRMTPQSRWYPQWNRKVLQERFGWQNYEHLELLGNVNYRAPERGMQLYDAEQGLIWLVAYLQLRDVVLLCGCPDLARCHRHLVCQLLHKHIPEVTIIHVIARPSATPPWIEQCAAEVQTSGQK